MPNTRTPPRTALRVVRVAVPIEGGAGAVPFLAAGVGGPRGFWGAGGEGWVAWRGALVTLDVDGSESDSGESRFTALQRSAARIGAEDELGGAPPRFFGGFSFREDHRADGVWRGFPAARFVLPEIELEETATGTELRVQALLSEGDDPLPLRLRLEARAEALREEVEGQRDAGPSPGKPPASAAGAGGVRITPSSRDAFREGVEAILAAIQTGTVRKVVLARTLDLEVSSPVEPSDALGRMVAGNPSAHLFLIETEPGAALLGAAPEVIARLVDGEIAATAVAGSIRRGSTPEEDAGLAEQLLGSAKDRDEQELTLRDMIRRLETRVEGELRRDPEPRLLRLARIQHLETRIRGRARPGETVLALLAELHPTPAVCGLPRDAALDVLRELEPFPRGWYAGPVGWFDTAGEGEFVPALRSVVGGGRHWRLFAGAGVVPGSDPSLEWEETGLKVKAALGAILGEEEA